MSDAPKSPTHSIRFTNGAIIELARIARAPGLLTKAHHTRRVSQFMREHVLRQFPVFEGEDNADALDWSDSEFATIELREKVRDALKALVATAQEKGAMSGSLGCGDLVTIFGLADED